MKKRTIISTLITIFLGISTTSAILAQTIKDAEITFKIKNAGLTVNGSLGNFEGKINFDPTDLQESEIEASVDVSTIDTGIKMRDKHLKKEDYFDAEKFPKINMESVSFSSKDNNTYEGKFNLTIKGHTEEIDFPFTLKSDGDINTFEGTFKIDRRDYGVGGNSFLLSDDVKVFIKVSTEGSQMIK